MKWRTEVEIPEGSPKIRYSDSVLTLGSCFADHLSGKLRYYQFPHLGNPFGVVFHPVPMERLLRRAVEGRAFALSDIFEHQGRWRCLETHSSLSGDSREEALEVLNGALHSLAHALDSATHVIMTLGTAFGYLHRGSGHMVANCQKLPSAEFSRQLSPVALLEESIGNCLGLLRSRKEELTCLLTVSPVRHVKDGLVSNQRSKAHLITAVHALVSSGKAHYFPAYELFMDELRDYRFYAPDLIHPTEQAVEFVWERFEEAWIDPGARPVMAEVDAIRKGLAHRPLHGDTVEHRRFMDTLRQRITDLQRRYPHMRIGPFDQE